jgi:ATP-dependent RNA helicase RhlE
MLTNPETVSVTPPSTTVERVAQRAVHVARTNKPKLLAQLLRDEPIDRAIVFARTKHGADRLADNLDRAGISATRIHGDRTQSQRNQALEGFKRGNFRVLVATDVAARGIHVDNIAHVVNYDMPAVAEDFIHRIGRTGRAGSRGSSWTFCAHNERGEIRAIERVLGVRVTYKETPDLPEPQVRDKKGVAHREHAKVVMLPVAGANRTSAPQGDQARPFTRSFSNNNRRRRSVGR